MKLLERKKANGGFLPSLRSNFDDLFDFDRFFDDVPFRLPARERVLMVPATNIRDLDEAYVVEVAAPGMTKKDFAVDIDNNILEIKVEKEDETKEQKEKYARREYNYNAFYRSFTLPENVIPDKIKAEYKEGILKVYLPKYPETRKKTSKEIQVD